MRCKTSESSRLEDFAYPWSCHFCCYFIFILLWKVFQTLLLIMSQSLGILVGKHLSTTPTLVQSWLWPQSHNGQFKHIQKMFVPNPYTATCCVVHWVTLIGIPPLSSEASSRSLISQRQLACFFGSAMHSFPDAEVNLSEVWFPQSPMPTGCQVWKETRVA